MKKNVDGVNVKENIYSQLQREVAQMLVHQDKRHKKEMSYNNQIFQKLLFTLKKQTDNSYISLYRRLFLMLRDQTK